VDLVYYTVKTLLQEDIYNLSDSADTYVIASELEEEGH
jgi:hypothetical protein